eukprot:tig00000692_g3258.t1
MVKAGARIKHGRWFGCPMQFRSRPALSYAAKSGSAAVCEPRACAEELEDAASAAEFVALTRRELEREAAPASAPSNVLAALFLPIGYPQSVPEGYMAWTFWQALRTVFLQTCSVISTEALLLSVGLSASSALPLSAIWNWVLKDGLGYLLKLLFGSRFAPSFDREPKRWRVACDAVMVTGGLLEVSTALFPAQFLILAALGNAVKACADAATGASYRVFLNSFAEGAGNIGDVSAKSESQIVAANVLGLALGVGLSAALGTEGGGARLAAAYVGLAVAHVVFTARAAYAVLLPTLNYQRLATLLAAASTGAPLPSPAAVNRAERFWPGAGPHLVVPGGAGGAWGRRGGAMIVLGAPVGSVLAAGPGGLALAQAHRLLAQPAPREPPPGHDPLLPLRQSLRWARAAAPAVVREAAAAGWRTTPLLLPPAHHLYRRIPGPAAPGGHSETSTSSDVDSSASCKSD